MKKRLVWISVLFSLVFGVAFWPSTVYAAKGTPESADFGYGARLDIDGAQVAEGIQAAASLKLDWVGIDFNWSTHWPDPNAQPLLAQMDQAMKMAAEQQIAVLVSISQAPAWAMTPTGPDPNLTAGFVVNLVKRYPALQAVELFPGANTLQGWGSQPDPQLYLALLQATEAALNDAGHSILLPAGGLIPLSPNNPEAGLDDLAFLQGLYQAGGKDHLAVVSLRLPEITGEPLAVPGSQEHRILRHYEEVRQAMLANDHSSGILWMTQFSSPTGTIQESDLDYQTPDAQVRWLIQAYRQLRAQLFIGVVFYNKLNPSNPDLPQSIGENISLIRSDFSQHPFYELLRKLVAQNNRNYDASLSFKEPQVKRIHKARL